jgi:hypothetical protein
LFAKVLANVEPGFVGVQEDAQVMKGCFKMFASWMQWWWNEGFPIHEESLQHQPNVLLPTVYSLFASHGWSFWFVFS